jgi:hypothetical protein
METAQKNKGWGANQDDEDLQIVETCYVSSKVTEEICFSFVAVKQFHIFSFSTIECGF